MDLYDIHTHKPPLSEDDDYRSSYILNVFPLGFEDAKDSSLKCFFSCGIHPWYAEDAASQLAFLSEIIPDSRIVAVGEAGYDKLKGPDMKEQQKVFEYQVDLSEQLAKPLIIHCVKGWDQLFVSKKRCTPKQPWIIHGYRNKPELTKQLLAHDFYFSIGQKYNEHSIQEIPADRLFCETDTAEVTIRSVYDGLSKTLNMKPDIFANKIGNNIKAVFPQLII